MHVGCMCVDGHACGVHVLQTHMHVGCMCVGIHACEVHVCGCMYVWGASMWMHMHVGCMYVGLIQPRLASKLLIFLPLPPKSWRYRYVPEVLNEACSDSSIHAVSSSGLPDNKVEPVRLWQVVAMQGRKVETTDSSHETGLSDTEPHLCALQYLLAMTDPIPPPPLVCTTYSSPLP